MAFAANKGFTKTYSSSTQDWDFISDGETEGIQERLSVASLESDESDTVVIFGGSRSAGSRSSSSISRNDSLFSEQGRKPVLQGVPSSTSRELLRYPVDDQHARLISAVSGMPVEHIAVGFPGTDNLAASPIEERLLKQISKLAQDLDDSQEHAKTLLVQNDKLLTENTKLKTKVEKSLISRIIRTLTIDEKTGKSDTAVKAGVTFAAGLLLVLQLKRKLLGLNMVGALLLAGSYGLYSFLQNEGEEEES